MRLLTIFVLFTFFCYGSAQFESFVDKAAEEEFSKKAVQAALKNLTRVGNTQTSQIKWYITKNKIFRLEATALCEDAEFEFWEGNTERFDHHSETMVQFSTLITSYLTRLGLPMNTSFHGPFENERSYFPTTTLLRNERITDKEPKFYGLCMDEC